MLFFFNLIDFKKVPSSSALVLLSLAPDCVTSFFISASDLIFASSEVEPRIFLLMSLRASDIGSGIVKRVTFHWYETHCLEHTKTSYSYGTIEIDPNKSNSPPMKKSKHKTLT